MKISGPGPVSNQSKVGGSKSGGGEGFSAFLDAASSKEEVNSSPGLSRIASVNFVQVIDSDEKSKRRQMIDEGEDLLDELLKIRDALLFGKLSAEHLRGIEAKLAKIEANCDDPALNEIIEEIKIRAAVELAKLGF